MKIYILIATIILLQLNCIAQEKLKWATIKHKNPSYIEKFQVKKSNPDIKHGTYKKILGNVKIQVEGQFENNTEVGEWKFYNTWQGTVSQIYNYTTGEVLFDEEWSKNNFDRTKYKRPVLYLGGMSSLYRDWAMIIEYPAEARRAGKQGKVIIKAKIGSEGKVIYTEIIEGIGYGCDEEVKRSFLELGDNWLPAISTSGEAIESEIVFPFTFKLN